MLLERLPEMNIGTNAAHWSGDEWRWRLQAPTTHPTITVIELDEENKKEREKARDGAKVVPFGFSRVLCEEDK
jgi:hypothetical protein